MEFDYNDDDDAEQNDDDYDDNLCHRKHFLTWTPTGRTVGAGVLKASKISG